MDELKIEYLNPADLTPYENNTRKHNPEDIEGIKKSILDVGFADPIGIGAKRTSLLKDTADRSPLWNSVWTKSPSFGWIT